MSGTVVVEFDETESAMALASLNGVARWRRQRRYGAKIRGWTGLKVVAEGVETVEAWDTLAGLQCDEAQGFYLGRPMAASEFQRRLQLARPR